VQGEQIKEIAFAFRSFFEKLQFELNPPIAVGASWRTEPRAPFPAFAKFTCPRQGSVYELYKDCVGKRCLFGCRIGAGRRKGRC
jgi:hypothetical protein